MEFELRYIIHMDSFLPSFIDKMSGKNKLKEEGERERREREREGKERERREREREGKEREGEKKEEKILASDRFS
jgi:hypothetical protein